MMLIKNRKQKNYSETKRKTKFQIEIQ